MRASNRFVLALSISTFTTGGPAVLHGQIAGWSTEKIPHDSPHELSPETAIYYSTLLESVRFQAGIKGEYGTGQFQIKGGNEEATITGLPALPADTSIGVTESQMRQVRLNLYRDSELMGATVVEESRQESEPQIAKLRPHRLAEAVELVPGNYRMEYEVLGEAIAAIEWRVKEETIEEQTYLLAEGPWQKFGFIKREGDDEIVSFCCWANHEGSGSSQFKASIFTGEKLIAEGTIYPGYPTLTLQEITLFYDRESMGESGNVKGADFGSEKWPDGDYKVVLSRKGNAEEEFSPEKELPFTIEGGELKGLDLAEATSMKVIPREGETWMKAKE